MLIKAALQGVRSAVLSRMALPAVAAPVSLQLWRGFADASYLDKSERAAAGTRAHWGFPAAGAQHGVRGAPPFFGNVCGGGGP